MSVNQERIKLFEQDLRSSFQLTKLLIEDESHLHAGHAVAAGGGGHFKVTLCTPEFQGLNLVGRHRAVYAAQQKHIPAEIHAITINALAPDEV